MLREWAGLARKVVVATDAAVLCASLVLACLLRAAPSGVSFSALFQQHLWLLWVVLPTWIGSLRWVGLYESTRFRSQIAIARGVVVAHFVASLTLLSVLYLSHSWGTSRLTMQFFLLTSGTALIFARVSIRAAERWVREHGRNARNVLVVGLNGLSERYLHTLTTHPFWGLRVVGCLAAGEGDQRGEIGQFAEAHDDLAAFTPSDSGRGERPRPRPPILGSLSDLRDVLLSQPVDEVAFAVPRGGGRDVARAVQTCVDKGVTARIVLDVPEVSPGRVRFESLDGLPVMSVETTPPPGVGIVCKRVVDIIGALVGLALCAVVYVVYGLRIRWQSPGPLFFRQTRIGQNGRAFVLYKFRTMVDGAESQKLDLADKNEMRGPVFKMRDDPRVIPVGRRMRARHLDEFPQFWNVLAGDMSLVGTRPPTPDEVALYDLKQHSRLAWKPGLTGIWQVKDGIDNFDEIVELDRQYISNWSLGLDLKILAQTVRKVVRAQGA